MPGPTWGARQIALILAAAMLLLAAACGSHHQPDPGVLRMGVWFEPAGLDPHRTSSAGSYRVVELLYEGLLELDENLAPVPCLAERVISEDDRTYRFELRRGVRFHTGKPFTSADVVYSLERLRNAETASPSRDRFLQMERIEALGPFAVRIRLRRSYPSFLTLLARPDATILPAGEALDFERRSLGTGPFELAAYRPHEGILLRRNARYWRPGVPKLAGIEMRFLSDNLTRVAALESGEVDLISHVPGKDVARLRRSPGLTVASSESSWFEYLGLNNRRRPLDDPRVRRALLLATDLQALVDVDWFGNADVVDGWVIPPWHPYAWRGRKPRRDVAAARRLLAEAGVAPGTRLRVVLNNSNKSTYLPVATVLESNWREAGIHLDLVFEDVALYFSDITSGNFDVVITGSTSYVDPEEYLCWFETGHPWNWQGFSRPPIDALLQQARFSSSTEERHALYAQVQAELAGEDVPVIPFAWARAIYAYGPRLRDFAPRRNFSNLALLAAHLEKR